MRVDGDAMSRYVREYSLPPLRAYRDAVFRDVLAPFSFDNLGRRATEAAEAEFGAQMAWKRFYEGLSDAGEAAREQGRATFETLLLVRQAMFNLLAAGLFHLVEQQLSDVCRHSADDVAPPNDTRLSEVAKWFEAQCCLNLESLPSWSVVDELHHVANAVKHGEGRSTTKLHTLRPVLFTDPEMVAYCGGELDDSVNSPSRPVHTPLAGADLYVTEELLTTYCDGAEAFFQEIAQCFREDTHQS